VPVPLPLSVDNLLDAGPCHLRSFQWPLPPGTTPPLNNPDGLVQVGPPHTPWLTYYQNASPQTGIFNAAAAAGQFSFIAGVPTPVRFQNTPDTELEVTIAKASLSNDLRFPLGTRFTASARFEVTPPFDPTFLQGRSVFISPGQENNTSELASADVKITLGPFGNQYRIVAGPVSIIWGSVFGFNPPSLGVGPSSFWITGSVDLPATIPTGEFSALFHVSVDLVITATVAPVDNAFERVAMIDMRPVSSANTLGGSLNASGYQLELKELRLLTCGRNPAAI